jgi:uncharacterized protein YabE (DUF348 family)
MDGLYVKYIKRVLPIKPLALLFIVSVLAITAGFMIFNKLSKDVKVYDNGKPIAAKIMGVDVEQALEQMEISVTPDDYISSSMDKVLDSHELNIITIDRAVPVNLKIDGELKTVMTYKDTIQEVIEDNGINLGPLDRFEGVEPYDRVQEGMTIQVVRVTEEIIQEEEPILFTVEQQPNKTLNEGETRIVTKGENGIKANIYKITYEDGKPIDRAFVGEQIIKQAKNQVEEYGTVLNFRNSRGDLVRYSKVLNMKATAYTSSFEDTGKTPDHPAFGITYTGMRAREGMIAVDPKVIPLWTKVYVEVPGPAPDYGFAIAADIGSAIKGNLIDLYFDSPSEVKKWGKRNVRVYILNEQNDTRWKNNDSPCQ